MSYSSPPSFNDLLAQRLGSKAGVSEPTKSPEGFDPHDLMLQRKQATIKGEDMYGEKELPSPQQFPEEDVKALEDYCRRMGIIGYSTRQHPKLALVQLKKQLGDFEGIELDARVIPGYEKMGQKTYGTRPNFPYESIIPKKTLLHG